MEFECVRVRPRCNVRTATPEVTPWRGAAQRVVGSSRRGLLRNLGRHATRKPRHGLILRLIRPCTRRSRRPERLQAGDRKTGKEFWVYNTGLLAAKSKLLRWSVGYWSWQVQPRSYLAWNWKGFITGPLSHPQPTEKLRDYAAGHRLPTTESGRTLFGCTGGRAEAAPGAATPAGVAEFAKPVSVGEPAATGICSDTGPKGTMACHNPRS